MSNRRPFFSAITEDPIVRVSEPDIWAYIRLNNELGNPVNRLVGYSDSLRKVVDIQWNSNPNGREPYFAAGTDGWFYGIFQQTSSPFKYRKVKRLKVSGGAVVVEDLYDLSAGLDASPGGTTAPSIFVGPSGVYTAVWDDVYDTSVDPHPFGKAWKRLSPSALLDKGDVTEAVSSWSDFDEGSPFGEYYSVATVTESIKRSMVPYVLKDGRWVVADVLCDYWKPNQFLDGDASGLDKISGADPPPAGADFVSTSFRAWGNAWWERANEDAALVNVANGGVSSRTADFAITNTGSYGLRDADAAPTPMGLVRNDHCATLYLPTSTLDAKPGMGSEPGVVTPDDDSLERQTWSPRVPSLVDGSYLYYMLGKDQVDAPALNGDTVSEGLYRAVIPAAGGTPVWTKIISEPDFDDSPQKQWLTMAVTAKWIWITEHEYTGAGIKRLWAYPKAGGSPTLVREDLNVGGEGFGTVVLAPTRKSMWK